jgi:chaperone required for assembly of F1-ATPase
MKRFYREVTIADSGAGLALFLDDKPALTPSKVALVFPHPDLAQQAGEEWARQGEEIVPLTMPLTRLAHTAIDGVAQRMTEIRANCLAYAASDLILYRAGEPQGLVWEQEESWDPILEHADAVWGARFIRVQGVTFRQQSEKSLARIAARIETFDTPFLLAALSLMTTLTGSVLIALSHADRFLSHEAAWQAAHIDELWQERLWGLDEEAATRRQHRLADFTTASHVCACLYPVVV